MAIGPVNIYTIYVVYFQNNLVRGNQGGLWLRADSRGSATSLRGWLHNNLFTENYNLPALYIEGRLLNIFYISLLQQLSVYFRGYQKIVENMILFYDLNQI